MISIDNVALLKATIHAAAHPSSAVLGVLLGPAGGGGETTRVTDALPLFHTGVAAPMLEVALAQAAHHASTRNAALVGVYAANERLADDALPAAARAAGDAAARAAGASRAVALLLDGATLADFSAGKAGAMAPFIAFTHDVSGGGGWKAAPAGSVTASGGAAALFAEAVAAGKLDAVADFDDHLIDLRKDWLNEKLVA